MPGKGGDCEREDKEVEQVEEDRWEDEDCTAFSERATEPIICPVNSDENAYKKDY